MNTPQPYDPESAPSSDFVAPADQQAEVDLGCDVCGAALVWDPGQDALLCSHCGNVCPVELREGTIEERPLESAGAAGRGLGLETRTLECGTCGARISLGGSAISEACAFCGSASLLALADNRNPLSPESLIPLDLARDEAAERFRTWLRKLWFRPNALRRTNLDSGVGLYVPAWTYDCHVDSRWSAEAGHYYYVTQTYIVRVNGKSQTRTRRVRKTRWVPARGHRQDTYDDIQVLASKGLAPKVASRLGAFDTDELVPYRAEYLAGWAAEEYQIDLLQGWDQAHQRVVDTQYRRCSGDVPGDTQRGLRVQNEIHDVRWKLVLLPVWSLVYSFRGKNFAVLVNGQTGQVAGEAPYSWVKIFFAVLAVVAVVGAVAVGSSG